MRQGALLGLYNKKGEILLQHRTADAPTYPNHWGFFGGGIEVGETPEMALVRESKEELEYHVVSPALVFNYKDNERDKYYFAVAYDESQTPVQHEGDEMKWWSIENLPELMPQSDKEAFTKLHTFILENKKTTLL